MVKPAGINPTDTSEASIEDALRWLATRGHEPLGFLLQAITKPGSDSSTRLAPLIAAASTASRAGEAKAQALAIWGLVVDCIRTVGPTDESRRRNVLTAAFRLPRRREISERWVSSLDGRFTQLKALPDVFGNPTPETTAPMHKAWKVALREHLVPEIQKRLVDLAGTAPEWGKYVDIGRRTERTMARDAKRVAPTAQPHGYRMPSRSAQPVFMDLFVTTVFMRKRSVYRRITERLITAQADGVASYTARALTGGGRHPNTPVRALWGCHVDPVVPSRPGEPVLTELRFPKVLQRGDKHYFSSEAIDEDITEDRLWVNVEVDHYGIAPGKLLADRVPMGGLTIRIRFDDGWLPETCWWYVEQNERERLKEPPVGDPRLLAVEGNTLQHTFLGKCHPRENYGISVQWPSS